MDPQARAKYLNGPESPLFHKGHVLYGLAEARKIKFRDAVIEKTVSGLVWMALVGIGYLIVDFLRNHGLRI